MPNALSTGKVGFSQFPVTLIGTQPLASEPGPSLSLSGCGTATLTYSGLRSTSGSTFSPSTRAHAIAGRWSAIRTFEAELHFTGERVEVFVAGLH